MLRQLALVLIISGVFGQQALAQQASNDVETARTGKAGYEDVPDFGGPESVGGQLRRADELRDSLYDWPLFDGYFDWKRQV